MARPDSRVMALIGNGAQSEFQAIAFHRMLGIRTLRLYDCDPQATSKLEYNLRRVRELSDLTLGGGIFPP
jgi:ornithine cyclodeaminase